MKWTVWTVCNWTVCNWTVCCALSDRGKAYTVPSQAEIFSGAKALVLTRLSTNALWHTKAKFTVQGSNTTLVLLPQTYLRSRRGCIRAMSYTYTLSSQSTQNLGTYAMESIGEVYCINKPRGLPFSATSPCASMAHRLFALPCFWNVPKPTPLPRLAPLPWTHKTYSSMPKESVAACIRYSHTHAFYASAAVADSYIEYRQHPPVAADAWRTAAPQPSIVFSFCRTRIGSLARWWSTCALQLHQNGHSNHSHECAPYTCSPGLAPCMPWPSQFKFEPPYRYRTAVEAWVRRPIRVKNSLLPKPRPQLAAAVECRECQWEASAVTAHRAAHSGARVARSSTVLQSTVFACCS